MFHCILDWTSFESLRAEVARIVHVPHDHVSPEENTTTRTPHYLYLSSRRDWGRIAPRGAQQCRHNADDGVVDNAVDDAAACDTVAFASGVLPIDECVPDAASDACDSEGEDAPHIETVHQGWAYSPVTEVERGQLGHWVVFQSIESVVICFAPPVVPSVSSGDGIDIATPKK